MTDLAPLDAASHEMWMASVRFARLVLAQEDPLPEIVEGAAKVLTALEGVVAAAMLQRSGLEEQS